MELGADLTAEAVERALPGRPVRVYPALLSTQADALAWARAGAPEGALVVADYQASPRGRGGLEWQVEPGVDVGFSLVLRPRLRAESEGWLYVAATCGLADALGDDARIVWPDEVRSGDGPAAAAGVHAELGEQGVEWAVVTVWLRRAAPARTAALARAVAAIEARHGSPTVRVLADFLRRCDTVGRDVEVRLVPLGPVGTTVSGRAVTALTDGALVVETAEGRRVAVRPHGGVLAG